MLCAMQSKCAGCFIGFKKPEYALYFGTFEVAVVLGDGIFRDLSQELQIKLIYFLFASGMSF